MQGSFFDKTNSPFRLKISLTHLFCTTLIFGNELRIFAFRINNIDRVQEFVPIRDEIFPFVFNGLDEVRSTINNLFRVFCLPGRPRGLILSVHRSQPRLGGEFSERALKVGAALIRGNKALAAALRDVGLPHASTAFILPQPNETVETRETSETVILARGQGSGKRASARRGRIPILRGTAKWRERLPAYTPVRVIAHIAGSAMRHPRNQCAQGHTTALLFLTAPRIANPSNPILNKQSD